MKAHSLCTVTVLGGRASVAAAHLNALSRSAFAQKQVKTILYVTHAENIELHALVERIAPSIPNTSVVSRNPDATSNPGGLDFEYDEILRVQTESHTAFLCLHDDTIVSDAIPLNTVLSLLDTADIVGYLDPNIKVESYERILVNGTPFSQMRVGTWFLLGTLPLLYPIGCAGYFRRLELRSMLPNLNLEIPDDPVWLNGNCLLNLLGRRDGVRFRVLSAMNEPVFATHAHAATWDLLKFGLLRYDLFDSQYEEEYLRQRLSGADQVEREMLLSRFEAVAARFEALNIRDAIVCGSTAQKLRADFAKEQSAASTPPLSRERRRVDDMPCESSLQQSRMASEFPQVVHIQTVNTDGQVMDRGMFRGLVRELAGSPVRVVRPFFENDPIMDPALANRLQELRSVLPHVSIELRVPFEAAACGGDSRQWLAKVINVLDVGGVNTLRVVATNGSVPVSIEEALTESATRRDVRMITGESWEFTYGGSRETFPYRPGDYITEHRYVIGCRFAVPYRYAHVCVDGQAALCARDAACRFYIGSVTTTELREIWLGSAYRTLRFRISTGGPDKLPCHSCPWGLPPTALRKRG